MDIRKTRKCYYNFCATVLPNNKVILTGDIHSSWANDVATPSYDAGSHTGSAAVEFVGPSVTSPSLELGWAEDAIQLMNEHIKFIDIEHRGFLMLDVTKEKTQGDYYFINNINTIDTNYNYDDSWMILNGNNWLYHADTATVRIANRIIPLAPACPAEPDTITLATNNNAVIIYGVYPNPVSRQLLVQFNLFEPQSTLIQVTNTLNQVVLSRQIKGVNGFNLTSLDVSHLPKGSYLLSISTKLGSKSNIFVKS
jgi:alkaline phosphatase D